jgi:hypothetical protein
MEINKVPTPVYHLTLSAEEITKLWAVTMDAHHKGIKGAYYFYDKLENVRPAGGFSENT